MTIQKNEDKIAELLLQLSDKDREKRNFEEEIVKLNTSLAELQQVCYDSK